MDRRAEQNAFLFILKHAVYVLVLAIWFRYDLSPITVKYVERRKPLYHFITTVWSNDCFTVIFTKELHQLFQQAYHKNQIQKLLLATFFRIRFTVKVISECLQSTMLCYLSFCFFQVCAIVGGTFTVAGIIDSIIFTASELFKKAQLGKLSQSRPFMTRSIVFFLNTNPCLGRSNDSLVISFLVLCNALLQCIEYKVLEMQKSYPRFQQPLFWAGLFIIDTLQLC